MNRIIKFRGLRADGRDWAYGNLLNEQTIGEVGENLSHYKYVTVIPETVGQFTGLLDKNGVEIYEGDVSLDEYGNLITITWVNEWGMFACLINEEYDNYLKNGVECLDETMFWTFPISEPNRIIVTGNIHEKGGEL